MDVWIETAAGNLVRAAAMAIVIRSGEGDSWEVCISASAPPTVFAGGLADKAEARSIRNALAVALSTARTSPGTPSIYFDADARTVSIENLG